jgi:hypothetical protein
MKAVFPDFATVSRGDYQDDPEFRARFQGWISDAWARKDEQIAALLAMEAES